MRERNEPLIRTSALIKTYLSDGSAVEALRGVDLTIQKGEFVAIMGPSGCGKSTLLNLMGGLDEPSGGIVYFRGQPFSSLSEKTRTRLRRQEIGYVFQSFDLLPLLSAQQNVEFPLALGGTTLEERRTRAKILLAQVGLRDKCDSMPDELSGGQKQRVAIARALANKPQVIFADEPTGSLDSLSAGAIIDLLRQIVSERKTTVVMVTHDEEDACRANSIIRLRDGRVVEEAN